MKAWLTIFLLLVPGLVGCQEMLVYSTHFAGIALMAPVAVATMPLREREVAAAIRPVAFAGTIRDEKGNAIQGAQVLLYYDTWRVTPLGSDSSYQEEVRSLDAAFNTDVPGRLLQLTISREGFYSRVFYRNVSEHALVLSEEAGKRVRDSEPMPMDNAHIVLRSHGALTQLERQLNSISVNDAGAGIVFSPDIPPHDFQYARWMAATHRAPDGYFYLAASGSSGEGDGSVWPSSLRLGITGAGNGLILHVPNSEDDIWYEMRRAPESGYQSEISFNAEVLAQLRKNKRLWFYFKCNQRYGRLDYSQWDDSLSGSRGARLVVEFQPDGTTNLEQAPLARHMPR